MPAFQARLAMVSELLGGILLTLGLATRPAAFVLIITMAVAGIIGHRGAGYLITNDPPGAEYTLNLAVVCAMFLLIGPGAISLDATLF
jgi:putative oxidoreductase